ncbi:short-chain dehydrogenase [Tenacibaculum jejuense]|uniref:Probable lipoprotein n=1 Tax=Tenacibaculum jejuense TaxID=584609 RepID=A0A238UB69_9FLAO|nr:short-chain dehydrogenase [Tenacibaculum jejuense]SNR16226.1 Probable lipoprotein precursor [Tenacibaculum jejuense]
MKKVMFLSIMISLFVCCSTQEKTDQELLKLDKKQLEKSLDSYKIFPYKFGKIAIRSAVTRDTISSEYQSFKTSLDKVSKRLMRHDLSNPDELSLLDYLSIYRDYKKMENFIMKTDEDMFPTVVDALRVTYGDSIQKQQPYFLGKQKELVQNLEHSVLSAIVILSKDLGKEVSLYECSKTNPEILPDSELKALLSYFRGFLFFEKKLYYLSEDEISRNITWLDKNQNVDLHYTRAMFQWGNLNNQQTHLGFHALNHLFRGFDRLMMKREIDEKRALEDFEAFLNDANKIGLNNEITWSIETFLYLKTENKEKAVASLTKLQSSSLLSTKEKEKIEESINYIKNRESGKLLNGVYDKFFLSKIATKYMFSVLSQVEWEKLLKENNVPHTEEMFVVVNNLKEFIDKLSTYTSADGIKKAGKDLKDKGKNLLDKAKSLME